MDRGMDIGIPVDIPEGWTMTHLDLPIVHEVLFISNIYIQFSTFR